MKPKVLFLALLCSWRAALAQEASDTNNSPSGGLVLTNWVPTAPVPWTPPPVFDPAATLAEALAKTNLPPGYQLAAEIKREVRPTDSGAIADWNLCTVFWDSDLSGPQPVRVLTPEGTTLAFKPCFLVLQRRSTKEDYLLATVTNASGAAWGSTVTYAQAFDWIDGSLSYVYGPGGANSLEQLVRINQDITTLIPEAWQTEDIISDLSIAFWTELIQGEPVVRQQTAVLREAGTNGPAVEVPDTALHFGMMRIVAGDRAYSLGSQDAGVEVAKSLIEVAPEQEVGADPTKPRRFIVEEMDLTAAREKFAQLNPAQPHASINRFKSRNSLLAWASSRPRNAWASSNPKQPMLLASAPSPAKSGVEIDWCLSGCTPLPTSGVSWWMGETNANDSLGTNHGTLSGGVTYTNNGKVAQCFSFDGSSGRVVISNSSSLNFGSNCDFTVECWIKAQTNANAMWGIQSIIDHRYAPSLYSAVGYTLVLNGGQLEAQITDNDQPPHYYNIGPAGPELRGGQWAHVAMVVDRDKTNGGGLYVNGTNILTFDPTSQLGDLSNSQPFRIGNHETPGYNFFFKGEIDEVTLYNRALAPNEIQGIYNAGAAGKCFGCNCASVPTNMVGWWPMDGHPSDLGRTNNASLAGGATYASAMAAQRAKLKRQWRLRRGAQER